MFYLGRVNTDYSRPSGTDPPFSPGELINLMGKVELNRAVHLALRDKNYEEVLGLFKYALEGRSLASRKRIISEMEEHIDTAYQEANFAIRGLVAEQQELDFIRFLRIFFEAVTAAGHIVVHEEILNQDSSFLNRFLSENPGLIREFRVSHRARASGIINDLKVMVRSTEKNFLSLKNNNYEALRPDEQRRYTLMYRSGRVSPISTPR